VDRDGAHYIWRCCSECGAEWERSCTAVPGFLVGDGLLGGLGWCGDGVIEDGEPWMKIQKQDYRRVNYAPKEEYVNGPCVGAVLEY